MPRKTTHRKLRLALAALAAALVAAALPGHADAAYGWPVKPFHRQHPVRGYLGDPRTGNAGGVVSHSLHFGIDVSAPDGTPVYAVMSGRVSRHPLHPDVLLVVSGSTTCEYWHIVPAITGGWAERYRTVIGRVEKPWAHVHLAERRGGTYLNPLRPGALTPFRDATAPTIRAIRRVGGGLVVDAFDTTPLEVPAPWGGLPVTPALVEWSDGRGWHTVVDFRATLPCASYSSVYAPGTTKNWIRRPGRYLFAAPSVPARAVRVRVVDTAGNSATATIDGSARVVRPVA